MCPDPSLATPTIASPSAPIRPRIVLVRHGRSAHVHRGWIDRDGLARWSALYDLAAIDDADGPPDALRTIARDVGCVVASDLPRAIASAERLVAPGTPFERSPLLREAALWMPAWPVVRLPRGGWGLAIGIGSLVRRWTNAPAETAIAARALDAGAWLDALATAHGSVLAVTHAVIRGRVMAALLARGWVTRERRGLHHWSAWVMERAPGGASPRTGRATPSAASSSDTP